MTMNHYNEYVGSEESEDLQDVIAVSISRAASKVSRGASYIHDDSDFSSAAHEDAGTWPSHVDEEPQKSNLHLGYIPSPKPDNVHLPSPWRAEPHVFEESASPSGKSVLKDALGPESRHRRSSSWGHTDLRRYLPSIPSLTTVSNLMPSFTHHHHHHITTQKQRSFSPSPTPNSPASKYEDVAGEPQSLHNPSLPPQLPITVSNLAEHDDEFEPVHRPKPLRRVTSDHSLLYHSLSRSSSLGDDSRWEDHHEMVNSRVKAIRDSMQDRSSFRLPSMPSLPNMPSMSRSLNMPSSPTFRRALNYLTAKPQDHFDASIDTDLTKGIIPGIVRKKTSAGIDAVVASGVVAATPTVPEPTKNGAIPIMDSPRADAFENCLSTLTGDVVIMGGYRGSILRSAKPPHRQLWVPVKVGLNIRKVDLEVGLDPEDEERMPETIFPSGMLSHIGPVDISRRLIKRLRGCENAKNGTLRIWDYGWDWRLSPALESRKLEAFLSRLPCNSKRSHKKTSSGALVIAHSLGGLITRHVVNRNPELFSGVIYAGTPQACVNILGPLRNGDAVLMSQRVLTAQVNFTLRTSFALLPLEGYCFEDKHTGEKYPVDYFNVDDWIRYRFSPCTDPPLPPKNPLPPTGITGRLKNSSFTNLSVLNRKKESATAENGLPDSASPTNQGQSNADARSTSQKALEAVEDAATTDHSIAPQMGSQTNPVSKGQSTNSSISTLVTIPREKAIKYLRRTLAEIKEFKLALAHNPDLTSTNRYPPFAVIYGKEIPTVNAARVDGRDAIACADCYDDLGFGSGDGVCLAKEAQLPQGYLCVRGGRISSDRGHVTLLGDLNAVGRAIEAVVRGRAKGIGCGSVDVKG